MGMSERRSEIRLALPKGSVGGIRGSGKILDVSPTGVRVEVSSRCVFARGETHRLVLSDFLESVEVEGRVRWTQSSWRTRQSQESEYFQIAGLAFSRLLSERPEGVWSGLLGKMAKSPAGSAPGTAPPQGSARLTPPLEMIDPVDGSTVSHGTVNVICTIDKPETLTGLRVNGVDAFVMGDLGTAKITLQKGTNRIVSMVRRRDGTYSTYLIGRIVRSDSH